MAIITNNTFTKLMLVSSKYVTKEDFYDNLEFFLQNIVNNKLLFYIFNFYEKRKLFTAKHLLENEALFIDKFYNPIKAKVDEKKFVFTKGGKYKYHIYEDCSSKDNEYLDFIIPQEIRDLEDSALEHYRKWFKDRKFKEKYIEAHNKDAINAQIQTLYNSVFPKMYNLNKVQEGYDFIREYDNSGNTTINEVIDFERNKSDLSKLLKIRKDLINNCDVRQKMSKFDFLLDKDDKFVKDYLNPRFGENSVQLYGLNNLRVFWKKHKKIKERIFSNLIEYFKWTYNFIEKDFDEMALNSLGFDCCKHCKQRRFNEVSINQTP